MYENTEFTLSRDCEAIQIPSGQKTTIPAGTQGRNYAKPGRQLHDRDVPGTGANRREGSRCSGSGKTSGATNSKARPHNKRRGLRRRCLEPASPVLRPGNPGEHCRSWSRLRLPVDQKTGRRHQVEVKMTLTAPGCGMGPAIAHDAQSKILSIDGIDEADVQLVWDPPWNQNMISEAGRMKLGMI